MRQLLEGVIKFLRNGKDKIRGFVASPFKQQLEKGNLGSPRNQIPIKFGFISEPTFPFSQFHRGTYENF